MCMERREQALGEVCYYPSFQIAQWMSYEARPVDRGSGRACYRTVVVIKCSREAPSTDLHLKTCSANVPWWWSKALPAVACQGGGRPRREAQRPP